MRTIYLLCFCLSLGIFTSCSKKPIAFFSQHSSVQEHKVNDQSNPISFSDLSASNDTPTPVITDLTLPIAQSNEVRKPQITNARKTDASTKKISFKQKLITKLITKTIQKQQNTIFDALLDYIGVYLSFFGILFMITALFIPLPLAIGIFLGGLIMLFVGLKLIQSSGSGL